MPYTQLVLRQFFQLNEHSLRVTPSAHQYLCPACVVCAVYWRFSFSPNQHPLCDQLGIQPGQHPLVRCLCPAPISTLGENSSFSTDPHVLGRSLRRPNQHPEADSSCSPLGRTASPASVRIPSGAGLGPQLFRLFGTPAQLQLRGRARRPPEPLALPVNPASVDPDRCRPPTSHRSFLTEGSLSLSPPPADPPVHEPDPPPTRRQSASHLPHPPKKTKVDRSRTRASQSNHLLSSNQLPRRPPPSLPCPLPPLPDPPSPLPSPCGAAARLPRCPGRVSRCVGGRGVAGRVTR